MELWKVELRENVKTTVAVTEAAGVAIVGDLRAVCRRRCIEVEEEEEEMKKKRTARYRAVNYPQCFRVYPTTNVVYHCSRTFWRTGGIPVALWHSLKLPPHVRERVCVCGYYSASYIQDGQYSLGHVCSCCAHSGGGGTEVVVVCMWEMWCAAGSGGSGGDGHGGG